MNILTSQMSYLLLILLPITTFHKTMCSNHTVVRCNEKDHETLSTFKQGIDDSFGLISTWSTEKDCCAWEGIYCDDITGRVTEIDLSGRISVDDIPNFEDVQRNVLKGEMNLCILELEFLSYLDLSKNVFDVIIIPSIQQNITHSSKLVYVDLSPLNKFVDLEKMKTLHMDSLDWLSSLSSLKYLNFSRIDLHKETNWLQIVNTLPSLLELQLSDCKLNNFRSVEYLNFTTSIVTLVLSLNNLTSHIPDGFFNLTKDLTYLDLQRSNIYGEIPSSLLNLQNLRDLYLSYNQLQGSIPDAIGNLSSLNSLSVGSNNFSGEISNLHFSKLSSLDELDLSNSNFVFQFDLDWVPHFQLTYLSLKNTNLGPIFPSWIYTQKSLLYLDLSRSGISSVDRIKFSSLVESIPNELILSNNSISEDISNLTLNCFFLRLGHNNFTGGLPNIPMALLVDLSYNSFSGSIPHSWKNLKKLSVLNLWSNRLSGEVPLNLSDWKQLQIMNLGQNEFSGTIPTRMSQNVEVVILRANQFEGTIPQQLFNLSYLIHLDLAHNKLSGPMPKCVYNLTNMVTINQTLDYITTIELFTKGQDYVYVIQPERRTIDLSANSLSGEVPLELFRLVQVQTLNLSHNNFVGTIPKTIGGMKNMESLDLSNNKFFGEIPQGMSVLTFLSYLNLSYNSFDGRIPIGTQLQSFNVSSYIGNPKLCGAPLNNCTTEEENPGNAENEDDESIREPLYLGMGMGFAVGFWGTCGSMFLIRKWRHAYFRFIYRVGDKVYVTLIVKLNSFHRN